MRILLTCDQPRCGPELMSKVLSPLLGLYETVVRSTLVEIDAVLHVTLTVNIWPIRL
jgi:hypothetical protein